ncbi:MAG: class I SAM-dependent methyltransferase [Acidimicrobiia bacterium]|nr:class I SAM-dependent methyltransferase [Acidimicrobiia bacterium]
MLTVDYDRLGVEPGDRVLDIGAGFGRHAFESFRRGAVSVACDLGTDELRACNATFAAMAEAGEAPPHAHAASVQGSTLALPFTDGCFDRVIASEVLEHVPDDRAALAELFRVLRPNGTLAVTVPAWLAESVCWKLDAAYHWPAAAGGHVRIYSRTVLRARLREAGFVPGASHHAHGLHTPYWWLKCAVGLEHDDHRVVAAYHRLLVRDITTGARSTRWAGRMLDPLIGKSLVMYATRPGRAPAPAGAASARAQPPCG